MYPGTACQICSFVSENNHALIEHISDNHEKVLVFLLKKEGLLLPPNPSKKDKTPPVEVKNETGDAMATSDAIATSNDIGIAIDAISTASDPIATRDPIATTIDPIATIDDANATTFDIIATKMEITESPILETVDSVDLALSVDAENKRPVSENVHNGLICYLCDEDLNNTSPDEIRQHLCNHYQPELDSKFVSNTTSLVKVDGKYVCSKCGKMEEDKFDFLDHMGIFHNAVDEFIPEKFRDSFIGKKQIILQAGSSMARKCAIPGCKRTLLTKEIYLMHLIYSHFRERLDAEFSKDFTEENTMCPICKVSLAVNKSGFMKHLGVVHEMGLKYIKEAYTEENTHNLVEISDMEEEETAAVCPNNS